jgi:hypothetical protein
LCFELSDYRANGTTHGMLTPTATDAVKTNTAPYLFTICDFRFQIFKERTANLQIIFCKNYLKLIFALIYEKRYQSWRIL